MIWKRCDGACVFSTPDRHEAATLPASRPKKGTSAADRTKPAHRVFDAMPDSTNPCPNNASCRCYILAQRIAAKGRDANKVDTETYYSADGDGKGALTQELVDDHKRDVEKAAGHWRYAYVAACLEVEVDRETGEVRPKRA